MGLVISLEHLDEISTFSLQRKGKINCIREVNLVIMTNGSAFCVVDLWLNEQILKV